jgi:hypothetical protein
MADLRIEQGTTWGIAIPLIDADDGQSVDLNGYRVRAQIRPRAGSLGPPLFEWSDDDSAPGTAVLTASQVRLYVTPAQSSAWGWNRGVYDVELTAPDGTVTRVASGSVYVAREVTR